VKTLKRLLKINIVLAIIFSVFYFGIYLYAKLSPKLSIESVNTFYLYDKDGKIFSKGNSNKEWVSLDNISEHLINATIAIEDKNFYNHHGFDFLRIGKALYVNLKSGKTLQGASTISQQYAKNLFLDFDKNWERKIEEAWLTIRLESHYTKDEILEGYLNTINYGGIFGIENAANYYFDKNAKDLTLAEASILAGIPKSPSHYSPLVDELEAKRRQKLILKAMMNNNYITEEEMNNAYNETLVYIGKKTETNLSTLMYYEDAVIEELKSIESIPSSYLEIGGLKIYTNLDMEAQNALDSSIQENLKENLDMQTSAVMIEPSTGKIIALAGGRDFNTSQFNRVTDSKRQVGSTMKAFLYYAALENGFTPSTTFISERTTFTFGGNKTYSPKNFNDKYPEKAIPLTIALAYSDNVYAVKTHLFLGEDVLVDTAKRMGIEEELDPIPSLALGSKEINIVELAGAYATLASEGDKNNPYLITKVEDVNGDILYEHNPTPENVLNKSVVYVLNELLSNCTAYDLVDYGSPSCVSITPKLSNKYAIKTGTTESDSWIIGYNKEVLTAVWAGYDDNRSLETGDGKYSKNIWADTTEMYLKDKEAKWYDIPNNVVGVLVNPLTGEVADNNDKTKKIQYYIKGTEPYNEELNFEDVIPTIKVEE